MILIEKCTEPISQLYNFSSINLRRYLHEVCTTRCPKLFKHVPTTSTQTCWTSLKNYKTLKFLFPKHMINNTLNIEILNFIKPKVPSSKYQHC